MTGQSVIRWPADSASVAEAWSALLGGRPVGNDDDFFFDLGGHSLLAVAVVTAMASESGLPLELQDLYLAPTPREFAAYLKHLETRLTELAGQGDGHPGLNLQAFVTALAELGAAAAESLLPDETSVVFSMEGTEIEPGSSRISILRCARGHGTCSAPEADKGTLVITLEDSKLRVTTESRDDTVTIHLCKQLHEQR